MVEVVIVGLVGFLIVWIVVKYTSFGNKLSVIGSTQTKTQKKLFALGLTALFVSVIMGVGIFATMI